MQSRTTLASEFTCSTQKHAIHPETTNKQVYKLYVFIKGVLPSLAFSFHQSSIFFTILTSLIPINYFRFARNIFFLNFTSCKVRIYKRASGWGTGNSSESSFSDKNTIKEFTQAAHACCHKLYFSRVCCNHLLFQKLLYRKSF